MIAFFCHFFQTGVNCYQCGSSRADSFHRQKLRRAKVDERTIFKKKNTPTIFEKKVEDRNFNRVSHFIHFEKHLKSFYSFLEVDQQQDSTMMKPKPDYLSRFFSLRTFIGSDDIFVQNYFCFSFLSFRCFEKKKIFLSLFFHFFSSQPDLLFAFVLLLFALTLLLRHPNTTRLLLLLLLTVKSE